MANFTLTDEQFTALISGEIVELREPSDLHDAVRIALASSSAEDGRWVGPYHGRPVDLDRRGVDRHLLEALDEATRLYYLEREG